MNLGFKFSCTLVLISFLVQIDAPEDLNLIASGDSTHKLNSFSQKIRGSLMQYYLGAFVKRAASAVILILLLISIAGAKIVNQTRANPYPYTNCSSSFVTVSITSPENKTYDTNNIQVAITAGAYPGVWQVWYSVDSGPYIEVAPGHPLAHTFSESLFLNRLSRGSHNIVAKATAMASNTSEGIVTSYSQVDFTIANVLDSDSQIISFQQAIEAANTGNHNESTVIGSYSLYGYFYNDFFIKPGVNGYLLWLAPNGTFYGAEYPTGKPLAAVGDTVEESNWNPPDGYYIWRLAYEDGAEYFLLANNGTLLLYNSPRGGGPTSSPPPVSQEIFYGIIVAVAIAIICLSLLVYFKKRKLRQPSGKGIVQNTLVQVLQN
jgi:hypothetical protein